MALFAVAGGILSAQLGSGSDTASFVFTVLGTLFIFFQYDIYILIYVYICMYSGFQVHSWLLGVILLDLFPKSWVQFLFWNITCMCIYLYTYV